MTRHQLYSTITPCGTIPYLSMVYLLESVQYNDPQIGYLLIQRIAQDGTLKQKDWILFAQSVKYIAGSPINGNTVESWLTGKCNLSLIELKTFLEYVQFNDGSQPTFVLSQSGDFIISE